MHSLLYLLFLLIFLFPNINFTGSTPPFPASLKTKETTTNNMENIFGKYKLETSENFDAFLKEIGVGLMKRKLANIAYPTLEISKDEQDYISIKTTAPFKTSTTKFRIGEEFDEERMDDKMVKSLVTVQGNTYTQIQKDPDNKNLDIKYIREFTDNEIRVVSAYHFSFCLFYFFSIFL